VPQKFHRFKSRSEINDAKTALALQDATLHKELAKVQDGIDLQKIYWDEFREAEAAYERDYAWELKVEEISKRTEELTKKIEVAATTQQLLITERANLYDGRRKLIREHFEQTMIRKDAATFFNKSPLRDERTRQFASGETLYCYTLYEKQLNTDFPWIWKVAVYNRLKTPSRIREMFIATREFDMDIYQQYFEEYIEKVA
jgi:hypothetical protein